jgi:uncharacterized protein (TIGR03437 family)
MKLLLALILAAPVFAQTQCTYSVSPLTINVGASGGAGATNIVVTAPDGCTWSAAVPQSISWIHVGVVIGGTSGGSGNVTWSVDANPNPVTRAGSMTVAGQIVTFAQAAADCSYTLSPTSVNVSGTGGPGSLKVTTGCTWVAGTTVTWVTVPAKTGGNATATVNYTVAANRCATPRSGAVVIGYPGTSNPNLLAMLSVSQDGGPNALTVAPSSLSLSSAVSDGSIAITTPIGCTWTASSDVSWVKLSAPLSGNGPSQIAYHILANTSVARMGNIHVGSLVIPVTQQGVSQPTAQVTAVKNAASYSSDAVSPGEIVAVGGVNIGPATPALLQLSPDGQSVTKSLGGVQVLFDGTPAAMIYASAGQVNTVVPYMVAGKSSTQVQVQYNGITSAALSMPVQAATPAIFTQDASGIGPGAILNQDYQVNSAANRAGRGDAIMVYCTGGGVTDPPGTDAAVTMAPYPQLTLPVTVTIGGIDAPVLYYVGAAPGAIAGLVQINAQVPTGVTPSSAVPISVKIGSWTSQPGVTVAVK